MEQWYHKNTKNTKKQRIQWPKKLKSPFSTYSSARPCRFAAGKNVKKFYMAIRWFWLKIEWANTNFMWITWARKILSRLVIKVRSVTTVLLKVCFNCEMLFYIWEKNTWWSNQFGMAKNKMVMEKRRQSNAHDLSR